MKLITESRVYLFGSYENTMSLSFLGFSYDFNISMNHLLFVEVIERSI